MGCESSRTLAPSLLPFSVFPFRPGNLGLFGALLQPPASEKVAKIAQIIKDFLRLSLLGKKYRKLHAKKVAKKRKSQQKVAKLVKVAKIAKIIGVSIEDVSVVA